MKRWIVLGLVCLTLMMVLTGTALAKTDVGTIQDGNIVDSKGNPVTVGYDQWGYNYQAHLFNGYYGNYSRPATPVTGGDSLVMKWNDAWLANTDANGDGKLDRPSDSGGTYIGSGAWCTNHIKGEGYEYFCKIVAVRADAVLHASEAFIGADGYEYPEGVWYTAEGDLVGPCIWGSFAVIQEISNGDAGHGIFVGIPGLGNW